MFVLVIAVGVLGLLHDSWPKEAQSFWINVHAVVGIVLWVTLLARYGYRRLHVPPPSAALWHQFIMHDALIQRIWPVRRRGHSGGA